jgi:hypothetical protein
MRRRFAFLPSARTALAAAADPPRQDGHRRRLDREVEVLRDGTAVGTAVSLGAEVLGAADVVGLDRRAIALLEPRRGSSGFEPNYFPYVDFVDADLPWRYSLDTSTGHRLQPWLALVALTGDEFEHVEQGSAPLPRIRVADARRSLPPIAGLWASAHVHVDRGVDDDAATAPIAEVVNADPAGQLSRLLCLRRLEERQRYELFLVPTFEAGRLAGLGRRGRPDVWDAPAWRGVDEPVELPVYLRSHFVTSALEDFELLVRRLRAQPAGDAGVGAPRTASAARPGYYDDQDRPERSLEIQAAMRPPGASLPDPEPDDGLRDRLATTLTEVIAGETVDDDGPDAGDPLVAMPAYGWRFRQEEEVDPGRIDSGWFHRLNLDLSLRQVAGLGAMTVREHQEELVAAAWDQYEEVVEANRRLARLEVAEELASRLAERRLERLPAEVRLTLEQPLHAAVTVDDQPVSRLLASRGVPRSFASVELRRMAARRPVRLAPDRLGQRTLVPSPTIPGDLTPDLRFERPERQPRDAAVTPQLGQALAATAAVFFLGGVAAEPRRTRPHAVEAFRSSDLAARVDGVLRRLPRAKADALVRGRSNAEEERIAPILRSPRITVPLAARLEQLDPGAILTGVETLSDDSVTVVEENRAFVEAFLVGANHELNHELRWRQFPTDMRGTVLPRFWDRGLGANDPDGDDTRGIHTWTQGIGRNAPGGPGADADLVLVIKGGIVRKLGRPVVVLNEAATDTWRPPHDDEPGTDHQPVFDGTVGDDVAYFGFDVSRDALDQHPERFFFVLYEPQHRLRFGLDIATAATRRERFSPAAASLPFPVAAVAARRPPAARLLPDRGFTGQPPALSTRPATWADLSRAHVGFGDAGYLDPDVPVTVDEGPDHWGDGRTSASIARSIWQKPVAAVLPARRIL